MNSVILIGRLTKDPELKYIPGSGTAVSTFTIAVDRDYIKKDGTKETDFIPIEVMGKLAEVCANNLGKGRLVAVEGSIKVNSYEKDGEKRTYTKVHANKIKFLDYKKDDTEKEYMFEPKGLDQQGFQAIDDPDIPF
ncbi:TPA: single-stranded DNA-binding protein [Clostridioides difficile]|uniref:single strand DNA binding protein n=2 Tax=root TaxID=1 RepID=UPI0001DE02C0|nr:single-stranded DNA-binding protein [Clostridioides difficile]YP_004306151.1 single strand DNA binding protein [Clostridium phage phiCD6356]ADK37912.1 putative single-strand binding protein [Clostridium phage phiCD6356]EGT3662960.1 single-stranded DNA-binding protein [Clostridioides difficile]EGT5415028.1 single-stranded DNA-binding protein [Clostridioides difficile]EGT5490341.1 single-stranded DNA-binding protein [Clostridioides difficile]EKG0773582.1 single-stranded DNA-binding protein [